MMPGPVRVLVVRAAGINCDEETLYGWRLAGAEAQGVHINALAANPGMLEVFDVVTIPGGFSFGDDIAAGVILAQRLDRGVRDALHRLVERGGGILGICNGFQVLVKAGLLPGGRIGPGRVTVTYNESARFEARWVRLGVYTDRCPFLAPGGVLELPVEHAEGRVIVDSPETLDALERDGHVALRYIAADDRLDHYPENPNGSVAGVAGLCDETGRVFALMPHPDRYLQRTQHPLWTRSGRKGDPDGLTVFRNAVGYWSRGRAPTRTAAETSAPRPTGARPT
jgi:phosphoribosylformylglycinamidine synthase